MTARVGLRHRQDRPEDLLAGIGCAEVILDGAPKHQDASTLATNSYGQTWTDSGFRGSWGKLRARLEHEGKVQPGLTIHGLRHTVATNMREEGFDERTIAAALGQKTDSMARHYSRDANLSRKMTAVAERLEEGRERTAHETCQTSPQKLSNPERNGIGF